MFMKLFRSNYYIIQLEGGFKLMALNEIGKNIKPICFCSFVAY